MATSDNDFDLEAGRMAFIEHLRELRDRVRSAAIAFAIAFGVCLYFSEDIYAWLIVPLEQARTSLAGTPGGSAEVMSGIMGPFWVFVGIALWAGLFVASPIIFHQIWKFVAPGLYKRERNTGVIFAVSSATCFVSGALFCYYFVLQRMLEYMLGVGKDSPIKRLISMEETFDLARGMMVAFGGVFQLPVLIFFLSLAGLVTAKKLWKFNRWFIVIAAVVGGILTPSPDVASQLLLAMPMIVLYNISIVVALLVERGRRKREAAESQ